MDERIFIIVSSSIGLEIKASWNTDRAANGPFEYDFDPFESCEASVEDLRTFIDRRREWVSRHIDEVGKVYADVTFVANGKTIKTLTGRVGEPLYKNFPKAPSKKGYYFKGWYLEGAKEAFDESDDIYDDITLYARWGQLEVKNGVISVEPYEYNDRNCEITISMDNFNKLIEGKLDPVTAFTFGKLKVTGDIGKALEFAKIIK